MLRWASACSTKAFPMRLLIAAFFLCPTAALADFFDGNGMHEVCEENRVAARFYAGGVWDAFNAMEQVRSDRDAFCLADNVILGQIEDVMCNYLEKNAAKRHLSASSLAFAAFKEAWPCPH